MLTFCSFDPLQPLPFDEELEPHDTFEFGNFVARKALRDVECWIAAWLRVEVQLENLPQYPDKWKRNLVEKEYNAIQNRTAEQHVDCVSTTCIITVRKKMKDVTLPAIKSVVATLELNIRYMLQGETFPEELVNYPPLLCPPINPTPSCRFGYIDHVYVAKSSREKGVARVYLHVDSNNKPAHLLYQSLGFESAKNKNVEHISILSGDHLYRMDYMDFVQRHVDTNADITVSCLPMDDSRASDYGLMKIDKTGRVIQFAEKLKGSDLKAMRVDTTVLGLSPQEAEKNPYIASMGVYVFRTEALLQLLRGECSSCNAFGSEIIPSAVSNHNVQPPKFEFYDPKTSFFTSPRFLPPTKVEKCKIVDAIISHGCFLRECSVQHLIIGVRSRLESGVEFQDTVMMGADYYQRESEIASWVKYGKVPIGVGENTKIRNCIIDKNAKIGRNVIIANTDVFKKQTSPGKDSTLGQASRLY